jgi:hypothetical protein
VRALLAHLSDTQIRVAIGAGAGLLALLLLKLRFCGEISLEPPPRPSLIAPPPTSGAATTGVSADAASDYARFLAEASAAHSIVPPVTASAMAAKLPYAVDENRYQLIPGGQATIETLGLRLSASVRGDGETQALVLRIDNLTDHAVAYNIVTRPGQGARSCNQKVELRHNAIAIRAGDFAIRSECTYAAGRGLEVMKIETVALPALSFFFVSALRPSSLGLDPRATDGHVPPDGVELCNRHLSASSKNALESGETTWQDMIDFYARHPCSRYKFPSNYKAFGRPGERELPVVAAD